MTGKMAALFAALLVALGLVVVNAPAASAATSLLMSVSKNEGYAGGNTFYSVTNPIPCAVGGKYYDTVLQDPQRGNTSSMQIAAEARNGLHCNYIEAWNIYGQKCNQSYFGIYYVGDICNDKVLVVRVSRK